MRQLLADTSFLVALVNTGDVHHADAVAFLRQLQRAVIIVTNYVFDETMTLLKRRLGSEVALRAGQQLRESLVFQRLHLTEEDEESTWKIFQQYADKAWSYTDCASLAVMQRLGIREILAFDRHFEQVPGIIRLPA
ncbi:MAG: PIN domain-containing protein [Thermoflexia bacterium]|nr:MAG: PIN domain-containing protein [Thermoflexia bacterium]